MPLYAIVCIDHKGSLALRQKTRDEHLSYCRAAATPVKVGGALLDENGQPEGSLLILECEGIAAAEAFAAGDPYARAGLFANVSVKPWRVVIGEIS